jgi:hypothetical protein
MSASMPAVTGAEAEVPSTEYVCPPMTTCAMIKKAGEFNTSK